MKKTALFLLPVLLFLLVRCKTTYEQADLRTNKVNLIQEGEYKFKDLNKNGKVDPYEDWRLPVDQRIDNLVGLMTLEEKVGLMFHPNIAVPADGKIRYDLTAEEKKALEAQSEQAYAGPIGPGGQAPRPTGNNAARAGFNPGQGQMNVRATAKSYIEEKNFRNILNNGVAEPKTFAEWSNGMQEIAEGTRLGIPIMFSTDPRHGATLGAHVSGTQYFSQWPSKEGQFGIAATRDLDLVKKYGEVVAEEYRAVGLHMILGPQIDVTTEPRWGRNAGAFSESAELTAEQLGAFMDGAQDSLAGPGKILVHLKHWPGAGPHANGTGQWLVYPGNNLDYHLIPWKTGIAKGALAAMGYYSGTYFDTLGVNYSKYISTELLYNQLGFKGVICTDWGVIGRTGPLHPDLKDLSLKEKFEMSINAGVDQFGSETANDLIIALVKEGKVPEDRINTAAKRILQWHFLLGLFENPYVDPEAAATIVQSEKNQKLAYQAQLESIILLTNDGLLPAGKDGKKLNLYVSGIDTAVAAQFGNVVSAPAKADLAIIRTGTDRPRTMGPGFNPNAEVNIDFPAEKWTDIKKVAASGIPVVVAFNPSGSLVVLPNDLKEVAKASLMVFDVFDKALLEVVFGKFNPVGKLPFDLPSSMEAVKKQKEDVPFDSEDPTFKFGFGLAY